MQDVNLVGHRQRYLSPTILGHPRRADSACGPLVFFSLSNRWVTHREAQNTISLRVMSNSTSGADVLVVCSWPLSGQYGVGSRLLYYALVFMCTFCVKMKWLRSVSLAAALVLPAVAAIHAVIITAYSTHTHGKRLSIISRGVLNTWNRCH